MAAFINATVCLPLTLESVCLELAGQRVLDTISLSFASGGISVILGPNGAGKTVLMKLCHGLLTPSSGTRHWHYEPRQGQRLLQTFIAQTPVLLRRTVLANIRFAMDHVPLREQLAVARDALVWAGIESLEDRPALQLSQGQQQLVALARARVMQPVALFLDEPTASLDPQVSRRVESLIRDLDHSGCKIIMSTHNLAQARRLASDIVFIEAGRISEQVTAAAFFDNPQSEAARAFLQHESPPG